VSIVAEQVSSTLEKYVPLLGSAEIEELRALAGPLEGATVSMVNSTAVGGGVAEILIRLLPLMREVGLEWAYRIFTEPRRLATRYAKDALIFPRILAREWWRRRVKQYPAGAGWQAERAA